MNRLAVPIVLLLLMLLAGAVWALFAYLDLPQMAGEPTADRPAAVTEAARPAPAGEQPQQAEAQATFDVVRIDPKGISVFAGRATPGENVTIMGDGEPVGSVQADENGEWTLATEHPFASADPKLALVAKPASQAETPAAQTKVAGSLDARDDDPQEAQPRKSASAVTSRLMKNFEGIVAAARTAAEEEKAAAQNAQKEVTAEAPPAVAAKEVPPAAPASQAKPDAVAAPPATLPTEAPKPGKLAAAEPVSPPATGSPDEPSPSTRTSIPVPITFVFNEATFTDDGRKAVELLLEYLQLKHFAKVTLTGHADERGTERLNMDLSAERLDTVSQYLKDGGFKGRLELIPKGESEPFNGVVRAEYPQEDLWQFDRRVELIIQR